MGSSLVLGRCHALLVDRLPVDLLFNLQPPFGEDGSRHAFFESLSDGQLLCLAHNEALKESSRAWGFIPGEAIHDVIALKKKEAPTHSQSTPDASEPNSQAPRVGLTFRRLENLKVWLASLKLRYEVRFDASLSACLPESIFLTQHVPYVHHSPTRSTSGQA